MLLKKITWLSPNYGSVQRAGYPLPEWAKVHLPRENLLVWERKDGVRPRVSRSGLSLGFCTYQLCNSGKLLMSLGQSLRSSEIWGQHDMWPWMAKYFLLQLWNERQGWVVERQYYSSAIWWIRAIPQLPPLVTTGDRTTPACKGCSDCPREVLSTVPGPLEGIPKGKCLDPQPLLSLCF